MKLRWLVKKYPEPTKEQCTKLLEEDGSISTLGQAYGKLKKRDEQSLQVCTTLTSPITGEVSEYWQDVPIVIEGVEE